MLFSQNRIPIDAASWLSWKKDRTTQIILAALVAERDEWAARLLEGETLIPGREAVETAKSVGIIYGLDCTLIGVEETLKRQWEEEAENGNGGEGGDGDGE